MTNEELLARNAAAVKRSIAAIEKQARRAVGARHHRRLIAIYREEAERLSDRTEVRP